MTAQPASPRPFAELDACHHCGAHRWAQEAHRGCVGDHLVCRECNRISERHDLLSAGKD